MSWYVYVPSAGYEEKNAWLFDDGGKLSAEQVAEAVAIGYGQSVCVRVRPSGRSDWYEIVCAPVTKTMMSASRARLVTE